MNRRTTAGRIAGITMMVMAMLVLCAGCGRDDDATPPAAQPPKAQPVTKAPKPTAALPANASCVTAACHPSLANAPVVHKPMAAGACDACHLPDAGGHVYPLKQQGAQLCTACHDIVGKRMVQHKAIAQQGCTQCHDPHVAPTKAMIKADTVQQLCGTCHDLPLRKFAHKPFAQGQCTVCHESHESDTKGLLRTAGGVEHCMSCHADMKRKLASAGHVHEPVKKDCITCHSPHTTDFPHELWSTTEKTCLGCHEKVQKEIAQAKVTHSAVHDGASCANCHDPHFGSDKQLLKARMDKACASCHAQSITTPEGRTIAAVAAETLGKNLHGPIRNGDCSACHQAHGGQHGALLKKPFPKSFYTPFEEQQYALCFSCHEKDLVMTRNTATLTNFRDGSRNLHYVHVHNEEKGRTCKTCHEMHGSNLPNHMASSVPFEGSNWAMPIRYEQRADGGSCAPGCHQQYTYSRTATTRPAAAGAGGGGKQ